MEIASSLFLWPSICLIVVVLLYIFRGKTTSSRPKLPPGPPGWPIVGNLFDLGDVPHQTLAGLAQKYGPVVWLKLGTVNTVVIQSSKIAKEMFKNHDLTYAGRTVNEAMRASSYSDGAVALSQYGSYWRTVKRLFLVELGVNTRLNETSSLRRKGVDQMIQWIEAEGQDQGGVHVGHFVFFMAFNLLGNLVLSRDLVNPHSKEGHDFFDTMDRMIQVLGQQNIADLFPFLKWLDPQRKRAKMERLIRHAIHIVNSYVKERIEDDELGKQKKRKDYVDALLGYEAEGAEEPSKISHSDLNILILEIFVVGTDSTSSTVEWAMTQLLRNPETMSKVRKELEDVVGCDRKMEESDIENLHYLTAVVKETLRLHPAAPFLLPRKAAKDDVLMGYHIPKDTQVLVNAWAIARDSDTWDDPYSFKPERFMGSDIDYRGRHFEFIPFGSGRRMCPGISLAHRVVHLALGSLIQSFDWELDPSVTPDTIDMNERMGLTLRKDVPLKAIPKKRIY